jgi:hypothetical protein
MVKSLPPYDILRQLLRYEAETGKLFWLERKDHHFDNNMSQKSSLIRAKMWNSKNANNEAFTCFSRKHSAGKVYKTGAIFGITYMAHRVAWSLHYGREPELFIDHIDGNGLNNRISNLRSVSHIQNMKNQKLRETNTSGVCGVSWSNGRKNGFWVARIGNKHIGCYSKFEDAVKARHEASIASGYHQNHGSM